MIDASQAEREARLLAEGRERILERVMSAEKAGKVQALPYANYLIRQALEGLASKIKADTVLKTGPGKSLYQPWQYGFSVQRGTKVTSPRRFARGW